MIATGKGTRVNRGAVQMLRANVAVERQVHSEQETGEKNGKMKGGLAVKLGWLDFAFFQPFPRT